MTLSPLVAMHHLDGSCVCVGNFLKLLRLPTVASEPGLCVDVICTSRTQRVVGDNSHTAYQHVFDLAVLLDEAAQIDITRTLVRDWFYRCASHTGGWRLPVSPTLVESDSMTWFFLKIKKQSLYRGVVFDA